MNPRRSKSSRQSHLRKVLAGLKNSAASLPTFTIAQTTYTLARVAALIEADIAASDGATQSHAQWLEDVQRERQLHSQLDPLLSAIKQLVLVHWGHTQESAAKLEEFGYAPRKKRVFTPEATAAAAEKARATRKARGTMGKRHKALPSFHEQLFGGEILLEAVA
jgi:hypothetical protein